jgi:hypothetical protein
MSEWGYAHVQGGYYFDSRAERKSWELLKEDKVADDVRDARAWAKRVLTDETHGDDRKLGVVKGNLGYLMDLVQRQELAIRLQEGTVVKAREERAAMRKNLDVAQNIIRKRTARGTA